MNDSHLRLLAAVLCVLTPLLLFGGEAEPADLESPAGPRVPVLPDAGLLAGVRDRTLGIPYEERKAWYHLLHHARSVSVAAQQAAAREHRDARIAAARPPFRGRPDEFPVFVDLFKNPREYRGRPVTLRGHVRKCISYPADENEQGVETLYEAWLFAEDAQQNAAVVVFTSLPAGMPLGENIQEQVAVTGYFFKMFGYEAQDTTRVAPMILAQSVEWTPASGGPGFETPRVLYGIAGALLLGLVWLAWRMGRKDRAFRKRLHGAPEGAGPTFTEIEED